MPEDNFYEELGLGVNATAEDIETAYKRLLEHLASSASGLSRDEAGRRLALVNQAYRVLSNDARRADYDSSLGSGDSKIKFAVEIHEERWSVQKVLLVIIGGVIAFSMVTQILLALYYGYRTKQYIEGSANVAETRTQSEIDAAKREREKRRLAEEERLEERERQEIQRKQDRELEENRRYAAQVSSELHNEEERARRETEQERRRAERDEKAREEAEKRRIREQEYTWQRELRRY